MRTTLSALLPFALMACSSPSSTSSPEPGAFLTTEGGEEPSQPFTVDKVQAGTMSDGRTMVILTASGDELPGTIEYTFEGELIELNDQGVEEDAEAADGLYTGISGLDLQPLLDRRAEYQDALIDQGVDPIATRFQGHAAVDRAELEQEFINNLAEEEIYVLSEDVHIPATTIFPLVQTGAGTAPPPSSYDPYKTLVITDPAVVYDHALTGRWEGSPGSCMQHGDPDGPFGFRYLMEGAAGPGGDVDQFITDWVASMDGTPTVNGYTMSRNGHQGVLDLFEGEHANAAAVAWPKLFDDGIPSQFSDTLDGSYAPLQLIAIVNRFDLGVGTNYGSAGEAELRFVFAFVNEEECELTNWNIILEYAVPFADCAAADHYAADWASLDGMTKGSAAYINKLKSIVAPVVAQGNNPNRPNDSNLKVVRANGQIFHWPAYPTSFPHFSSRDWQMLEWGIGTSGDLELQTLAQQPGWDWNEIDTTTTAPYSEPIDAWIDANESDILDGIHVVPATYNGSSMAAPEIRYGNFGDDVPPYQLADITWHPWRGMTFGSENVNSVEARQRFSLATCSGCHGGETFEDGDGSPSIFSFIGSNLGDSVLGTEGEEPFRHVLGQPTLGDEAKLSRFLTGTNTTCTVGAEFVAPLGTLSQCPATTCCPIGDPVFGYTSGQVHYNEFDRRGDILQDAVLNGACHAFDVNRASVVASSAH